MGRVKLQIKRIENKTNRQVTFSKRRNGLIKKAYELSVLCDIDIALIMFSPSDRLSHFSGRSRIEDVLTRYANMPEHDRRGSIQNVEYLVKMLEKLKCENEFAAQLDSPEPINNNIEELQQEINSFQHQLRVAKERLRVFEPEPMCLMSLDEMETCEGFLLDTLARVTQRKNFLTGGDLPPYDAATFQAFLDSHDGLLSGTYQSEVSSWVSDGAPHPAQVYVRTSEPLIPISDPTTYDALQSGPGCVQVEPSMPMGSCQVGDLGDGCLPPWHQAYTSAELLSMLVPAAPLPPLMQQPMAAVCGGGGAEFGTMGVYPGQVAESAPGCCPALPSAQPREEPAGYDVNLQAAAAADMNGHVVQ